MKKSFYADQTGTGCGTCQRICLSGRISLVNGYPQWDQDIECYTCFACLSYCPEDAVQLKGRKTEGKPRYHHTQITAGDIARQKE